MSYELWKLEHIRNMRNVIDWNRQASLTKPRWRPRGCERHQHQQTHLPASRRQHALAITLSFVCVLSVPPSPGCPSVGYPCTFVLCVLCGCWGCCVALKIEIMTQRTTDKILSWSVSCITIMISLVFQPSFSWFSKQLHFKLATITCFENNYSSRKSDN